MQRPDGDWVVGAALIAVVAIALIGSVLWYNLDFRAREIEFAKLCADKGQSVVYRQLEGQRGVVSECK